MSAFELAVSAEMVCALGCGEPSGAFSSIW